MKYYQKKRSKRTRETKNVKAFGAEGAKAPLKALTIQRRAVAAHDVEIEILFCGICHSDLHQAHDDFGGAHFPMVPGHEMVGREYLLETTLKNSKLVTWLV